MSLVLKVCLIANNFKRKSVAMTANKEDNVSTHQVSAYFRDHTVQNVKDKAAQSQYQRETVSMPLELFAPRAST